MKKVFVLLLTFSVALILSSCDFILKPRDNKVDQEQEVLRNMILGSDKDKHGCVTSAGYRWSEVKHKCIRIFDEGMRLVPAGERSEDIEDDADQALLNAYFVIDSVKNRAEVFIAADTLSTIVLVADGDDSYKNENWKLITNKQFKLELNGNLKYISPLATEKTSIGSDVEEQ